MQKIEKIGYRGTQPFNLLSIDCVDPGDDFFRSIAAGAMVKKSAKGSLIVGVLVDVGDSEFGLPQECMIRTFENLSLLGDRMNNDLQCRTPICRSAGAGLDFGDDLRDSSSDRKHVVEGQRVS